MTAWSYMLLGLAMVALMAGLVSIWRRRLLIARRLRR